MDSETQLLIHQHRDILTKMIENNKPYEEILEQSQLLDNYILLAINDMNKEER